MPGEAAVADIHNRNNIRIMEEDRQLASTYALSDILNMNETGLYWKLSPSRTLATEAVSGGKKSKDRITLAFTTNATGTDRLMVWVIGKSKNPRCFKSVQRRLLGVEYRNNKTKWMTGQIVVEYLNWLNNYMAAQNRHVLLFMDNF